MGTLSAPFSSRGGYAGKARARITRVPYEGRLPTLKLAGSGCSIRQLIRVIGLRRQIARSVGELCPGQGPRPVGDRDGAKHTPIELLSGSRGE